jgi:hypothetical protein
VRALEALWLLAPHAPYLLALPPMLVIARRSVRARTVKWLGMFLWSIPVSLLPFMKAGGFLNNLIPMIVLAGPVTLFVLADVLVALRHSRLQRRVPRWLAFAAALVSFAATGWFIFGRPISIERFRITAAQRDAALKLNAAIGALEGGVLIPDHPFLAIRNGHTTPQFHEMSYQDCTVAGMRGLDLPGFLRRTGARWAILSGGEAPLTVGWFHLAYERVTGLTMYANTLTGYFSSPRLVMKLREPIVRIDVLQLFDFEDGLASWEIEGGAFTVVGRPGSQHLSSWRAPLGDDAQGTAVSPPFAIERDNLELWIGGGGGRLTRVELLVEDEVVQVTSAFNTDMLTPVIWDVRALRDREVRLRVVDEATGHFGHISIDLVRLFDRGE